jgi:uncharacterized damage-inducible protein DinB
MTLARLAGHVAELPGWAVMTMKQDSLDLSAAQGEGFKPGVMTTREALLTTFDKNVAEARAALESASDEDFMKIWSLIVQGRTAFQMPRVAVVRNMVMNHTIHHRAQLGVYLRLNDIALPGMYGPSGDEPNMFASGA